MSNRATGGPGKPPLYKIVMLGDSGVGKTSLVARLTNPDRPLNHDISATMGIEFDTQMLDTPHGKVKAQIWDTAGQERFARVLLPTYFRKAKGVILVYDIANAKSFESLSERWMAQLNDHASADELAKLLVGNKSDLEGSREVPKEKAQQFCQEYGMEMLETSAKSGENVLKAFEKLIGIVHDRALAANKNKAAGGIQGMNGASVVGTKGTAGGSGGSTAGGASGAGGSVSGSAGGGGGTAVSHQATIKLDEGKTPDQASSESACGC